VLIPDITLHEHSGSNVCRTCFLCSSEIYICRVGEIYISRVGEIYIRRVGGDVSHLVFHMRQQMSIEIEKRTQITTI
jgi:hypothetical protein